MSDLITNTSNVVAGGSFNILRQKTIKIGVNNLTNKPLSNDIQGLLKEFHNDADIFKEVRLLSFMLCLEC